MNTLSNWLFPKIVENPNIEKDITRFLSPTILDLYNACADENERNRIIHVCDMLEFVYQLQKISDFLKNSDHTKFRLNEGCIKKYSNIEFNGIDFSGFPYDTEALILYLLLSLIDTCAGQNKYINFESFIKKVCEETKDYNKSDIVELVKSYNEQYGLNKNFKKALQDKITDKTKCLICDNCIIIKEKENIYKKEEILNKIEEWNKLQTKDRISKISNQLYTIRSKYTHSNIRSFISTSTANSQFKGGLLVKKDAAIFDYLKAVIIDLCTYNLNNCN